MRLIAEIVLKAKCFSNEILLRRIVVLDPSFTCSNPLALRIVSDADDFEAVRAFFRVDGLSCPPIPTSKQWLTIQARGYGKATGHVRLRLAEVIIASCVRPQYS